MKLFLLKKILWSQHLTERMKTSSQSPAPESTALHQRVRVQLPFLHFEKQAFCFVFLFFAPVTRLTRTCVNTLLWSNSVFLHQSSSFLTEVVFDIESCMQKAHWYCERITVHVINSFIFYFLSVFDVMMYVGTKIHCIARCTIFVLVAIMYSVFFTQFAGKVVFCFVFFGHPKFLN